MGLTWLWLHGLQWLGVLGCLDPVWQFQCALVQLVQYCDREKRFLVGQVGGGCVGHDDVLVAVV